MSQHKKHLPICLVSAGILFASTPVFAADPGEKPAGSWITVNGTVVSATDNSFRLDYGEGLITVEMDDWDWYGDAYMLLDGDNVTVRGIIDDDLFEKRTIEASSVYVENLNSYFYANPADEEDMSYVLAYPTVTIRPLEDGSWLNVSGTVASIDGREFTLDTGGDTIEVDTDEMIYNPLDDEGIQQIDKGDYVSVSGALDLGFFEGREIEAYAVTSLNLD